MTDLSLQLFGPFAATYGSQPLDKFRTVKVPALLIYLVSEPPIAHRREALMNLLWPDMPLESAQTNLRQIIYQLRKALPEVDARDGGESVPLLLSERLTLQLNPQADVTADAATFGDLLEAVRVHKHGDLNSCSSCRKRLEEAVQLYKGPFLADFYLEDSNEFEDWASRRREAYRRQVMDALAMLASGDLLGADFSKAQIYAQRQLELDDLDERATRQLMEALARDGRRHEALAVYEEAVRLLRDELGMAPSAQTTRLAEQIGSDSLEAAAPRPRAVRGYKLLEEIGHGAFGVVHRAYQPVIGREVVIKIIRPRYANHPDFIRRFEAEAQTIARLEHPYIVPLYDYWREPDNAYLVMRWLRGGSLEERLESGPLAPDMTAGVVDQLAAALYAAHRQHIIHRDVKAANILLDQDDNAYLSDFSVAKDLLTDEEPFGLSGSPAYLSPEQLLKEDLSPQTDQYSLGIVIYQMLTGNSPFLQGSSADILRRYILNEPLPLIATKVPGMSGSVDDVLQRATAKKPGDRFPDMIALARAFHQAVGTNGALVMAGIESRQGGEAVEAEAAIVLNPYRGLRPFQESDATAFFGREALVAMLLERLQETGDSSRFLAVVGPSGGGKSSAVKAGLLPALRGGAIPGSENWFITEMTPGRDPLQELSVALTRVAVDPPAGLLDPLLRDERGLINVLERILPLDAEGQTPQLLLLVDQFEELFTLTADEAVRDHFINNLLAALNEPDGRLRVIATLRADFYDRPLQTAGLGELLRRRTEVVLPLNPAELERAITQPAALAGVSLEAGLLAGITADVSDQPGTLPLMQYALTELFERRENEVMTVEAYRDIGGVSGALAKRADEIYQGLDDEGQEAARQMFLRLVTLGEGVEDTRRRVLREELEAVAIINNQQSIINNQQSMINDQRLAFSVQASENSGQSAEDDSQSAASIPHSEIRIPHSDQSAIDKSQISHVIDTFGQYRLLTFDRDPATRGPTVEVAHEALLREWPRLRDWLDESRADVRLQRLLAAEAAEWQKTGQDASYLLRGARLDQYEEWSGGSNVSLTAAEQAFLEASFTAREARLAQEEARRRRELAAERQRAEEQTRAAEQLRRRALILAGALGIAALLAIAAIFFANQSSANAQAAEQNALTAQESADLAATSEALALENEQQALANEQRAEESAALAATREAEAITEAEFRATAETDAQTQRDVALQREREALQSFSLSLAANARQALEADDPSLAMLLVLAANGIENPPLDAWRTLLDVAYAPGAIREYDVGSPVNSIAASPDGATMLSGSDDGLIRVWDIESGELLHTLEGHKDAVAQVAFSPDGRQALSGGGDGGLLLWDTDTWEVVRELEGHSNWIGGMAFLPDGRALTGEDAGRVPGDLILWDLETGEILNRFGDLEEQVEGVRSIAVTPDGLTALVGYGHDSDFDTSAAAIWDIENGEVLHFLAGPEGFGESVNSVALTPDGLLGLGVSDNGRVYTWAMDTGALQSTLSGHNGLSTAVGASPNGVTALSGALDGGIIYWDLRANRVLERFQDHQDGISALTYLDEDRALSASWDGTVRLWDLSGRWQLERWHDPTLPADHAFNGHWISPDGRFVLGISESLTTGEDYILTIWDYETGTALRRLEPVEGYVADAAFTPDGRRVLTANHDGTLTLWDVATGRPIRDYEVTGWGAGERIYRVDISSDGRHALSGGFEEMFYWDLETGEILQRMNGHFISFSMRDVRFLPGDRQAVSAGGDGTVVIWDLATGEQIRRLTGLEGAEGGHLVVEGISTSTNNVNRAIPTADGRYLLTAADDTTLLLWDLASGQSLRRFRGHAEIVLDAEMTADGRLALTAAPRDGMILWDVGSGRPIRRFQFPDTPGGGGFFPFMEIHPDGQTAVTDYPGNVLVKWQLAEPQPLELLDWIASNRALRELTCLERETYRIEPFCVDGEAVETTADMLNTARQTTANLDTTPEPLDAGTQGAPPLLLEVPERVPKTAVLGENRGELTRGDFDVWTYEGRAGEIISLRMVADRPLTDRTVPVQDRYAAGVLDAVVNIKRPDGSFLSYADDETTTDLQRLSDARFIAMRLPEDGPYRIEARSALDDQAGPYTLIIEQVPSVWYPEVYEEYVGHYVEGPWQWNEYFFIHDGRTYTIYPDEGNNWFEVTPLNETEFAAGGSSIMRMQRDANGEVSGFEVLYGYEHIEVGGHWYTAARAGDLPPGFVEESLEKLEQQSE